MGDCRCHRRSFLGQRALSPTPLTYKISDGHDLRFLPVPLTYQVDGGRTASSIGLSLQWTMSFLPRLYFATTDNYLYASEESIIADIADQSQV